jgi:hypothetical protein
VVRDEDDPLGVRRVDVDEVLAAFELDEPAVVVEHYPRQIAPNGKVVPRAT